MFSMLRPSLFAPTVRLLSLPYALAFSALLLAVGLAVFFLVQAHLDERNRSAVEVELNDLLRIQGLNELRAQLLILARATARDAELDSVYLLVDRSGECPFPREIQQFACPAGNISGWPSTAPDADGWIEFRLDQGRGPTVLGRVATVAADHRLLVGRIVEDSEKLLHGILVAIAAAAGIGLVGYGLGAWLANRWFVRRVRRINATLAAIGQEDVAPRIGMTGPRDELTDLASRIDAMLNRIAELLETSRTVTDHVAHELRTPLTRLRIKLENLLSNTSRQDIEESLARAVDDIDQLQSRFEAILETAKIATYRRADFADVALSDIVDEVVALYQPIAELRGIRLSLKTRELTVSGQRDLLLQMIANLVDNAIKYSPKNGNIGVALEPIESRPTLTIVDQGPGIDAKDRDRVFERFYRAGSKAGKPGLGLGLTFVRAVAKLHDVRVELEDAEPGLKVILRFPPPFVQTIPQNL
jgi:signal transduction histidine kinase